MKILVGCVALVLIALAFHRFAPPQHNPLKPLSLSDPIGFATYSKLTNVKHSRRKCFMALDDGGVGYTPRPDEKTGADCGFKDALTLDRSTTPYSATIQMTCAQTAALYIWEAQVMKPLANDILGSQVAEILTYGTYSCRNIAGSSSRSEHASANAIDIAGFRLKDGRVIRVQDHWGERSDEGKFLRKVHKGACRLFSVTLGPDYNAAHADHFHFDMGSADLCE